MRLARLASAILLLLPLASAGAQMIPPHPTYQGFEPIGEYELEMSGAVIPGIQLYRSDRAGSAVLMVGPGLPTALMIVPRERAVMRVDRNKVAVGNDGRAFLLADAQPQRESALNVQGAEVAFTVGGKPARLKEKPWLLGLHRGNDLLQHDVAYAFRAKQYNPSPALVGQLKKAAQPIRVRVFFGNWCPHCQEMVPRILRVEQALAPSNVKFEFYGLPSPFGNEPEAKKMGITGVPTGVVYRGNTEVGRISGNEWSIPELAIKRILDGSAKGPAEPGTEPGGAGSAAAAPAGDAAGGPAGEEPAAAARRSVPVPAWIAAVVIAVALVGFYWLRTRRLRE